jgi:hypothetical protein
MSWSAIRLAKRNAVNVRTRDADVGELAIAQMRKLSPGFAMALPLVEEAGNGSKHVLVSNPFPGDHRGAGRVSASDINGRCALHHIFCCSAAKTGMHAICLKVQLIFNDPFSLTDGQTARSNAIFCVARACFMPSIDRGRAVLCRT